VVFVFVVHIILCNFLSMLASEPWSWKKESSLPCLLKVGLPWPAPIWLVARTGLTGHGQCHLPSLHLGKRRQSDPSLCTCSTLSTCLSF
jgi:hypothetical protein